MGIRRRLDRLEARAPTALGEDEVRAEACRRLSMQDLTTLEETCQRLDELAGPGSWDEAAWEKLTGEEVAAFESAYARYEEAVREEREGR